MVNPNSSLDDAVISSLLLDTTLQQFISSIDKEIFLPNHKLVFINMEKLYQLEGEFALPRFINFSMVNDSLRSFGGVKFLQDISSPECHCDHVDFFHYLEILTDRKTRGYIKNCLNATATSVMTVKDPFGHCLDSFNNIISLLPNPTVQNILSDVDELFSSQQQFGVSTGISAVDDITFGFLPARLWVVAARTGVGKTAIACQMALSALYQRVPVVFVSLEMPKRDVLMRLFVQFANGDTDKAQQAKFKSFLKDKTLIIKDDSSLSMDNVSSLVSTVAKSCPNPILIVDYLQLITPAIDTARHLQVGEISLKLKAIAKSLDITVIALSQLSRQADQDGVVPRLSHLRESGSIEQDADVVLFIHPLDSNSHSRSMELIVAKNRYGYTKSVKAKFNPAYQLFSS